MGKHFLVAMLLVALVAVAGCTGEFVGAYDTTTSTTAAVVTSTTAAVTTTGKATTTTKPASTLTRSQENAIRKAQDYLDYSAFSRKGLVGQLEYEGFSTADATFAVDHLNVDWKLQAAKKAEEYLKYSPFSRSGLFDQLIYEGFTEEEAEYGVGQTGL